MAAESPPPDIDFAPLGVSGGRGAKTIDILQFALSTWKLLAGGLAGGLLLGWLAYQYLGPTYQADTRVEVTQKSTVSEDAAKPNFSGERTEHVHLIKSDAILSRAVEVHGLKNLPAFDGASDASMEIADGLTVKRSAGEDSSFVNIIDISYLHPDRETAREVVTAVVAAYADYLRDLQNKNSGDLLASLERRQSELDEEIDSLQEAYHQWRDTSPFYLATPPTVTVNGNVVPGKNPYQARVEKIGEDIGKNQLRQSEVSSRIATLQQLSQNGESQDALEFFVTYWLTAAPSAAGGEGGGGGGQLLSEPEVKADLDRRYLEVHMMLDRLSLQLGEDHVNVRRLREQLATLRQFYDQKGFTPPDVATGLATDAPRAGSKRRDLVQAYMKIMQQDLVHLEDLGSRLRTELAEAQNEAKEAALFEVEDQRRKDEIARKKEQWRTVTTELETFGVRKEQEGYRVEQIAQVRVEKSMKRALKIVGACGALGIVLVFALAYLREWSDTRLKTMDELRANLDCPILGEVPHFAGAPAGADARFDSRLCYYHRPASREAEAYRTIRAGLLHLGTPGRGQILQISSPEPGDGKSVSAANLALAIAQSGKKVLLIDADLRRPTIHELCRLPQDIGLADVLKGEIDWQTAARATQIDGLSVITAGACPENPGELLLGAKLAEILAAARREFDFVVVDSPPILAVSDPAVIAPLTDGLVLVVRLQKNKRGALRRTLETLAAHNARLLGVAANDVDPTQETYRSTDYDVYYTSGRRAEAESAKPQAGLVEAGERLQGGARV
ncbi:MAG: polysaccharide biosynthesis tyrosine autokinase [Planctomycetaceae bacterium]|nr:polysaccharide biosynthesis tyrosine autokinase [Planctomycetaceae bacterium]